MNILPPILYLSLPKTCVGGKYINIFFIWFSSSFHFIIYFPFENNNYAIIGFLSRFHLVLTESGKDVNDKVTKSRVGRLWGHILCLLFVPTPPYTLSSEFLSLKTKGWPQLAKPCSFDWSHHGGLTHPPSRGMKAGRIWKRSGFGINIWASLFPWPPMSRDGPVDSKEQAQDFVANHCTSPKISE